MGLYLTSYGVDVTLLKRIFNSRDEHVFQALAAANYWEEEEEPRPAKAAIRQIVFGEPYNHAAASDYGYALKAICNYLGVDLSGESDMRVPYVTDLIDEYLELDFGVEGVACYEDLLMDDLALGLPPIDGFPEIGFLDRSAINELYGQLESVDISEEQLKKLLAEGKTRGDAYEGIKSFKARIDYCHEHQLELVSFLHL